MENPQHRTNQIAEILKYLPNSAEGNALLLAALHILMLLGMSFNEFNLTNLNNQIGEAASLNLDLENDLLSFSKGEEIINAVLDALSSSGAYSDESEYARTLISNYIYYLDLDNNGISTTLRQSSAVLGDTALEYNQMGWAIKQELANNLRSLELAMSHSLVELDANLDEVTVPFEAYGRVEQLTVNEFLGTYVYGPLSLDDAEDGTFPDLEESMLYSLEVIHRNLSQYIEQLQWTYALTNVGYNAFKIGAISSELSIMLLLIASSWKALVHRRILKQDENGLKAEHERLSRELNLVASGSEGASGQQVQSALSRLEDGAFPSALRAQLELQEQARRNEDRYHSEKH